MEDPRLDARQTEAIRRQLADLESVPGVTVTSWALIEDPGREGFPLEGAPAGVYVEFRLRRRAGRRGPSRPERLQVGPIAPSEESDDAGS